MSEHVNKPETAFKTQEEINLKVSDDSAAAEDAELPIDSGNSNAATEQICIREAKQKKSLVSVPQESYTGSDSSNSAVQKIESIGSKSDYAEHVPMQLHKPPSSGLNRHRAIVAVCAILSCSFLGLSAFDLKHLIGKQAVLSEDLKMTFLKSPPELPVGCTYVGSRYADWLLDDTDYINEEERVDGERLIQIVKHTWDGRKLGYADKSGKIIIPPQFDEATAFHDGLASVVQFIGTDRKFGFIDETGKIKIPAKFDGAMGFRNGVCIVKVDRSHGLINKSGEYILKPSMKSISELGQNFSATTKRGKWGILGQNGEWLLPPEYSIITPLRGDESRLNGYPRGALRYPYQEHSSAPNEVYKILSWAQHQWGLVDDRGNVILPPKYDDVVSYENGVAAVTVNGKVGFVRPGGQFVIQPQYEQATPYADVIAVRNHGPWSFIDKFGKALSGPSVDAIVFGPNQDWFADGLAPFVKGGKVGYMNAKGQIAIPPQFDLAMPFVKGHAIVWAGDCWKFIDTAGMFVPGLAVQDMSVFIKGRAYIINPGPFYKLVEFARLKAIMDAIKDWKEFRSAKRQGIGPEMGDE